MQYSTTRNAWQTRLQNSGFSLLDQSGPNCYQTYLDCHRRC